MDKIVITSPQQLDAWLKQYSYFQECYCLSLHPNADEYPYEFAEYLDKPDTVVIELAFQSGGGCMAGDIRIMQVYGITAHDVQEWRPGSHRIEYIDNGVKVIKDGLGLDLGRNGRLVCRQIVIERIPDRSVPVEPNIDSETVSVQISAGVVPTPKDWIDWFREAGEDVVWRTYGGEEWPVSELYLPIYSGFIQRRQDISTTKGGIFIEIIKPLKGGFGLNVDFGERRVQKHSKLWHIARELLLRFHDAKIKSGNGILTSDEWRQYIMDGTLPSRFHGTS